MEYVTAGTYPVDCQVGRCEPDKNARIIDWHRNSEPPLKESALMLI